MLRKRTISGADSGPLQESLRKAKGVLTTGMPLTKHTWPLSCHELDWLVSREFLVCGPHFSLSPILSPLYLAVMYPLGCQHARSSLLSGRDSLHFFASLRLDIGSNVWAEVMPYPSSKPSGNGTCTCCYIPPLSRNQQLRGHAVHTCSLCPSMGMYIEMDVSSSVSSTAQEQGCSYNIPILYPPCVQVIRLAAAQLAWVLREQWLKLAEKEGAMEEKPQTQGEEWPGEGCTSHHHWPSGHVSLRWREGCRKNSRRSLPWVPLSWESSSLS